MSYKLNELYDKFIKTIYLGGNVKWQKQEFFIRTTVI